MGVVTVTAAPPEVASLVIAEVYTNVWQGEGPSAGRLCSFIRLGGCNLTCGWARTQRGLERVPGAWACDEPHTWHSAWDLRTTLHRADAESVIARLTAPGTPELVVITGGEPLIHQDQPAWGILLRSLLEAGRVIEIETNGTITPVMGHRRIRHNVSPKLACSGLPLQDRYEPGVLEWHAGHASIFKFVVTGPGQVAEAAGLAASAGVEPGRVWIMPEGITCDRVLDVARRVAAATASAGFNLTLRQQVLLYGEAGEPRDR